ncbi:MAG: helix-turn-helix transcriptional regulator [Candidatus Sumerlaeota bacterium]|nr:helix-turn-helix transcriptional regulator [Candidatus Sumerlaeota bacterium]
MKLENLPSDTLAWLQSMPTVEKNMADIDFDMTQLESDPEFVAGWVATLFIENVSRVLMQKGMTKKDLADRIGMKKQQMQAILNQKAPQNLTIKTIARIACALGLGITIQVQERSNAPAIVAMPKSRAIAA